MRASSSRAREIPFTPVIVAGRRGEGAGGPARGSPILARDTLSLQWGTLLPWRRTLYPAVGDTPSLRPGLNQECPPWQECPPRKECPPRQECPPETGGSYDEGLAGGGGLGGAPEPRFQGGGELEGK